MAAALIFSLLPATAATDYVKNNSTDLSANGSWQGGAAPGAGDTATFDSGHGTLTNPNTLNTNFTTGTSNLSWGNLTTTAWTDSTSGTIVPIYINATSTGTVGTHTLQLNNTAGANIGVYTTIGNLVDGQTSTQTYNLASTLTVTGALSNSNTTAKTIAVTGGGTLNLIGSSNTANTKAINFNLNNATLAIGGNNTNNFGSLTLAGNSSIQLHTGADTPSGTGTPPNSILEPAITSTSQTIFNTGFTGTSGVLTINGWQGSLGSGTSTTGTDGQLIFKSTGQTTGTIVSDVVFDLSDNAAGASSRTNNNGHGGYIPNFTVTGNPALLTDAYDYGEWIALTGSLAGYDELVPYYGPIPEPGTVLGGLALLGLLGWRERRRLQVLYVQFFSRPERPAAP